MSKKTVSQISKNYNWSQDYELLCDLMEKESIVCKVQCLHDKEIYDCANTLYNGMAKYAISACGICYVTGNDRKEFINSCKRYDVSFLVPIWQLNSVKYTIDEIDQMSKALSILLMKLIK